MVRIAPAVRIGVALMCCSLAWPSVGQDGALEDSPLVAAAWEHGCLTAEEGAAMALLLQDAAQRTLTQQGMAAAIPEDRRSEVWACLRTIPVWLDLFRAALVDRPKQEVNQWRFRADLRQEAPAAWSWATLATWQWHRGRFGAGGAVLTGPGTIGDAAFHLGVDLKPGRLVLGNLSGRFGQGLVVWTPGPFDDLGGVEGSHRIPTGIRPVIRSGDGVMRGVGWRRSRTGPRWSPDWLMAGRNTIGHSGTLAAGGGKGRRQWAVRIEERPDGRWSWMAGLDGGMEWRGWSGRWAAACFKAGWTWRGTLLRTWSRQWEGHLLWERTHPEHPGTAEGGSGSAAATTGRAPEQEVAAGLAFHGPWRGWVRCSRHWSESPPMSEVRRTSVRVERGAHRWDWRSLWRAGEGAGGEPIGRVMSEWNGTWRVSGKGSEPGAPTWNASVSVAGRGSACNILFAGMATWKGPSGHRLRCGFGQSWGSAEAPVGMVRGWDGRPAEPFRTGAFKSYLRWRHSGGHWHGGLTITISGRDGLADPARGFPAIHAVRVEFRS